MYRALIVMTTGQNNLNAGRQEGASRGDIKIYQNYFPEFLLSSESYNNRI